jgi:hypothetical protein
VLLKGSAGQHQQALMINKCSTHSAAGTACCLLVAKNPNRQHICALLFDDFGTKWGSGCSINLCLCLHNATAASLATALRLNALKPTPESNMLQAAHALLWQTFPSISTVNVS